MSNAIECGMQFLRSKWRPMLRISLIGRKILNNPRPGGEPDHRIETMPNLFKQGIINYRIPVEQTFA